MIIKQYHKLITNPTKKKFEKDRESFREIFQKARLQKKKKEIKLITEIKICEIWIEKKEKNI